MDRTENQLEALEKVLRDFASETGDASAAVLALCMHRLTFGMRNLREGESLRGIVNIQSAISDIDKLVEE